MSETTAVPQMVALAREAKGMTQRQLADQAGLSQGFLSKIEAGLLPLSGEHLSVVAKHLGCPVALLTNQTTVQGLEVTCIHHRRFGSKIPAVTKRRVEALTHLTRLSVEGLMAGVELIPETQIGRLDIDQYEDPATVAQAVRAAWRLPSGPVPNKIALLESVGVVVVVRPLGTHAQDAVSTWPQGAGRAPLMLINTAMATDRQRFTTAHELGHLVMHSVPGDTQEAEADTFAAEFLAPAADIEPQLAGLTTRDLPRLMELKAQWGMSIAALIRRAKDLDIISDRQYREFQVKLRQLSWHRAEPVALRPEQPATLNRVIAVHLDEHDYSHDDLAQVALMEPEPFSRLYLPEPVDPRPATPLKLVRP